MIGIVDALGHLGYALLFGGIILIGRKWAVGWLLCLAGDLIWLGLGVEMGMTSIWSWQVAFLAMALYNWRRWRREGKVNPWTSWTSPRESSSSSTTAASAASGT